MVSQRFGSSGGPPGTGRKAGGKRNEAANAHPRQSNVLAQLQKTQSLNYPGQIVLNDAASVTM